MLVGSPKSVVPKIPKVEAAIHMLVARTRVISLGMISKAARKQADLVAMDIDPKDVAYVAQLAVLWTLDRKLAMDSDARTFVFASTRTF